MRSRATAMLTLVLLAVPVVQGVVLPRQAVAQAAADKVPQAELDEVELQHKLRRSQYRLDSRISRYLEAAIEDFHDGKPEEGKELLSRLKVDRLNPWERAQVFKLRAFMDYGTANYAGAIENFQKVLQEQIMPVKDEIELRFSIAQLYAAQQKWKECIAALQDWLRYVAEPEPLAFYLLAVAHFQLEQYDKATEYAETAIDMAPEPKEGWLQLLAALYVRQQDYERAAPVFEELVTRFPKKEYWVQLSLIYGAREDYRNSLAVQQIAYEQGLLTEDKELRRLARSYLFKNLPYPAAKVLEKGIQSGKIEADSEAYEMLANSWIAAREYEKAIEPLTKAADLADDGKLYIRLGQVYMQREEWGEAARLFQKALAKGGLSDLGQAQLLLGISYYNNQQVDPARQAFRRAREHESSRKQADAWIGHIARETEAG